MQPNRASSYAGRVTMTISPSANFSEVILSEERDVWVVSFASVSLLMALRRKAAIQGRCRGLQLPTKPDICRALNRLWSAQNVRRSDERSNSLQRRFWAKDEVVPRTKCRETMCERWLRAFSEIEDVDKNPTSMVCGHTLAIPETRASVGGHAELHAHIMFSNYSRMAEFPTG